MGYKYQGPKFDELPEGLRERIREAARVAENETGAMGVVLSETTGSCRTADELWKSFGTSKEVFVYDFGHLNEAYFNVGDKVYHLRFCGAYALGDMKKVEKALEE